MKKEKLLTITVLLLILLNLGTLAFIFFDRRQAPPPLKKFELNKFIVERLNLNEEQQKKFDVFRSQEHIALENFNNKGDNLVSEYFSLLKNENYDPAVKDSIEKLILNLELLKARSLFLHFEYIKSICNKEQKESFGRILPQLVNLLNPPPEKNYPTPKEKR